MDQYLNQLFLEFNDAVNEIPLFDLNRAEKLQKLQKEFRSKLEEYRKSRKEIWRQKVKSILLRDLPQGYSWKRRPTVREIEHVIDKTDRRSEIAANKKGGAWGARSAIETLLFESMSDSNRALTENIAGRFKNILTDECLQEAKKFSKLLRQAAAVPCLLKEETRQELRYWADMYNALCEGRIHDDIVAREHDIRQSGTPALTPASRVRALYNFLRRRIKLDKVIAKNYGSEEPKTISFLNQIVLDILPNPENLTPDSIKSVALQEF